VIRAWRCDRSLDPGADGAYGVNRRGAGGAKGEPNAHMAWLARNKPYDRTRILAAAAKARKRRRYQKSLELYQRVLEVEPENPDLLRRVAPLLAKTKQPTQAWDAYRRAAELATAPDQSAMAHANLGSLELLQGRLDEAIDQFALALADNPRDATSLFNWASALAMQERIEPRPTVREALRDEAVRRLDAALALHPRYAKAHLLLGTILLRSGDHEIARARLETAATIDPGSAEARRARELLQEVSFASR